LGEIPTFQRNISLPVSGLKSEISKKLAEAGSELSFDSLLVPEDVSDIFLQEIGISPNYKALNLYFTYCIVTLYGVSVDVVLDWIFDY
jgi:hypothetical protein